MRPRTLDHFFGEGPTHRFRQAPRDLGINAGNEGENIDVYLGEFRFDLPAFAESLTASLEILITSEGVAHGRQKRDEFREALRQPFLDSIYCDVHAALFQLSLRHSCVWVKGQRNYAIRVAHMNHSRTSGVSLIRSLGSNPTVHGLDRLEITGIRVAS